MDLDLNQATGRHRAPAARLALTALALLAIAAAATAVIAILVSGTQWAADLGVYLVPARALFHGRPPALVYFSSYPATTFVLYLPLVLLPDWLVGPLTQLGSLVLIAWVVGAWGRIDGQRPSPWVAALLLSPPTLELVYIDQMNTAIALASLSASIFLVTRSHRAVPGALIAVTTLCRPMNAIVAVPALAFLHRRQRSLWRVVVWAAAIIAAAALLAWCWDRSLVAVLFGMAEHRLVIGVSGFVRDNWGNPGLIAFLAALVVVEISMIRSLEPTHSSADIAAIILAISVIPVALAGPYTAVYVLPLLVRLAARSHARAWVVGYSVPYSLLWLTHTILSRSLPATDTIGTFANVTFIFAPVLSAVVGVYFLAKLPGSARPRSHEHAATGVGASTDGYELA
jgi:hypothetical protein